MLKLMNHQIEAVDFAVKNSGVAAFFHEIGCGKTISALSTYTRLREKDPGLKMMVICPLSLIESAWGADIKEHTVEKYLNLNRNAPAEGYDIYIINFESFISEKRMDVLMALIRRHRWLCVIDESSKLKNNTAKTTKTILKMRQCFKYRIVMSGTPAPNSEMEYWGQMTFLRDGIFHWNFYAFRNTYFDMRRGLDIIPGQMLTRLNIQELHKKGYKYSISPDNRKKLVSRMLPLCHSVKKDDCMDLPEQINQYRVFKMGADQRKIYMQMKEQAIAEILNESEDPTFVVAKIALTKLIKLRQIVSGFAIDAEGRVQDFGANPKLNELEDLIDQIGDKQAIIWCNFKREIADVSALLGDRACFMYGDVDISDREQAVVDFKSGKKQFLVANPASAGHGLTFVNANIEIFYSMDFSYEKYEQARGRIHRYGQKNKCLYIHLMAEESVDKYILDVVQKKKTVDESIREFINERQ